MVKNADWEYTYGMSRFAPIVFLLFFLSLKPVLRAEADSQWMWHGDSSWVYSHAESSWWYMPMSDTLTSSQFTGWVWHGACPWLYSFDESSWRFVKSPSSDGKLYAWKHEDGEWYCFEEVSKKWMPAFGLVSADISTGDSFTISYLSLEMLWCDPGTFEMGSPLVDADRFVDEGQRTVILTKGFWLGKQEVTQAQWQSVMGANPSFFIGEDRPVEQVSWTDAIAFCDKLSEIERKAGRLPDGMIYQLPTEAQWEYACRAGTKTAFSFGDSLSKEQANFGKEIAETTAVGSYPANAWGFHDMHGNVWEWCADWYWYENDTMSPANDPQGHKTGFGRIRRGGSWLIPARLARSPNRNRVVPDFSYYTLGLRISLRPIIDNSE